MFTLDDSGLAPVIKTLLEKIQAFSQNQSEDCCKEVQSFLYASETAIQENKQERFFQLRPMLQGEYDLVTLLHACDGHVHLPHRFKTYLDDRIRFITIGQ